MTAKEYLNQAYRLDHQINSKLSQIESLRSLTQKVTRAYDSETVSHTRNVTSMEETIYRLMEAEEELNQSIDALVDLKMEIAHCIAAVESPDDQILLEKRYLCFHSWERIASDLQCTVRWVHTLHARALRAVDRILPQKKLQQFPLVHKSSLESHRKTC